MALNVYVNKSTNDLTRAASASDFVEVNLLNDRLIFSAGSDVVKDGEPIPSSTQLNSAALLITDEDVEVPHFFLADASDNLLREIFNAGPVDKRYVFCAAFDAVTASEPILELWDDETLSTITSYSLGQGVANDSFFRGIVTTGGSPGASWTGSRLAGSSEGHFLWLNDEDGALEVAADLYFNLRITIPADFTNAAAETPVMVIKWTEN